ncbi:transposase [Nitrobacter winogradskyi]|uniref:Transposase n=1 Tax=Nitrobacter winogradskyi TaxID=913 RepID=A0ACC6AM95_NITWI|nr:transposase [Nitrobacter winogradskyi]
MPLEALAIRMFRMVIAEARSLMRPRRRRTNRCGIAKIYLLLRQIPGIGPINALTIIAEAGDLRRFHHHRITNALIEGVSPPCIEHFTAPAQ